MEIGQSEIDLQNLEKALEYKIREFILRPTGRHWPRCRISSKCSNPVSRNRRRPSLGKQLEFESDSSRWPMIFASSRQMLTIVGHH